MYVCECGGRLDDADRSEIIWTVADICEFCSVAATAVDGYDGRCIRLRRSKGWRGKGRRVPITVGRPLLCLTPRCRRRSDRTNPIKNHYAANPKAYVDLHQI